MCLAVPGRITGIRTADGLRMGDVDFGGVAREICLDWVPEARPGDFVLVHVGFAIGVIDEEEARETLRLLAELADAGRAEDAADPRRAEPEDPKPLAPEDRP
jgi:hydrogenase expression/formation protein HypC